MTTAPRSLPEPVAGGAGAGPAAVAHVRLADRVVAIAAVKTHPDHYTGLFSRARSEVGHAVCLCRTDQMIRLVIRCRAGRYHLATWPDGGHQHAPACTWYRSHSSVSGRGAFAEAITTTDEGTAVRLAIPLIVRGAAAAPTEVATPAQPSAGSSTSRRTLTLLGFLHLLWEQAQLNVWQPGLQRRTWQTCRTRLAEQADDLRANTLALGGVLWTVPPFHPETATRVTAD